MSKFTPINVGCIELQKQDTDKDHFCKDKT